MFLLNANNVSGLNDFLQHKGWLQRNETVIAVTKPGEGNMNCVLRITTNIGTYIIKQSRGYVEKYPQVPAPKERAKAEAAFYHCIKQYNILKKYTPELLRIDKENNILLMEDVGKNEDYSFLYKTGNNLNEDEVYILANFLNELHNSVIKNFDPLLLNAEMKKLNHQYIFVHPFTENNGLNLDDVTEGLQALSIKYKTDIHLKEKARLLGEEYLKEGDHLLHGDFYPGSWVKTDDGIKIIDPEFSFFGKAEFDIGVMLAHCYLSEQPQEIIDHILKTYQKNNTFNSQLLNQFTGIEMMRRILGLAQLPLICTLQTKEKLLHKSYNLIMA